MYEQSPPVDGDKMQIFICMCQALYSSYILHLMLIKARLDVTWYWLCMPTFRCSLLSARRVASAFSTWRSIHCNPVTLSCDPINENTPIFRNSHLIQDPCRHCSSEGEFHPIRNLENWLINSDSNTLNLQFIFYFLLRPLASPRWLVVMSPDLVRD